MGIIPEKYKESAVCQLMNAGYEPYEAYLKVEEKDEKITEQVYEWLENESLCDN